MFQKPLFAQRPFPKRSQNCRGKNLHVEAVEALLKVGQSSVRSTDRLNPTGLSSSGGGALFSARLQRIRCILIAGSYSHIGSAMRCYRF